MIVHAVVQGSDEWLKSRAGIPTASDFDQLVKEDFEPRTGEMPRTYLAKKLAEKWLGYPLPSEQSFHMEQGSIREDDAIPWFEMETGIDLQRPGFITDDEARWGCSPDGMIDDARGWESLVKLFSTGAKTVTCDAPQGGLEIKCPSIPQHVKWLMKGVLPPEHAAQVYGSMLVTGAPCWTFLSYRPKFPPLLLPIPRDEEKIGKLRAALDKFNEDFQKAFEKLKSLDK